jgi:hypothetical protein
VRIKSYQFQGHNLYQGRTDLSLFGPFIIKPLSVLYFYLDMDHGKDNSFNDSSGTIEIIFSAKYEVSVQRS